MDNQYLQQLFQQLAQSGGNGLPQGNQGRPAQAMQGQAPYAMPHVATGAMNGIFGQPQQAASALGAAGGAVAGMPRPTGGGNPQQMMGQAMGGMGATPQMQGAGQQAATNVLGTSPQAQASAAVPFRTEPRPSAAMGQAIGNAFGPRRLSPGVYQDARGTYRSKTGKRGG